MASKTSVTGNRVTIDDFVYDVKVKGAGKHIVIDEFGGEVGRFTLTGRTVEAEDYGTEGAKPIALIAKLWVASAIPLETKAAGPTSKMVCRVVTHDKLEAAEVQKARAYQAWLKKQQGVKTAFFAHDETSGKAMSMSVWDTRDRLSAFDGRPPPDAPDAPKAARVDVVPLTDDL